MWENNNRKSETGINKSINALINGHHQDKFKT
jgi:hypothetical protein